MEVRPHGALDHAAPERAVGQGLIQGIARQRRHQSGVEHVELRAGAGPPDGAPRVVGQARHDAGVGQEIQVVADRRCVPGVPKPPHQVGVRDDLPRVLRDQVHELAHQRGLVHPCQRQDVAPENRRDDGIHHIAAPHLHVPDQRRGPPDSLRRTDTR